MNGDFTNKNAIDYILKYFKMKPADVICCDASPEFSGVKEIDYSSIVYLNNQTINLCKFILKTGGTFLMKSFNGNLISEIEVFL